MHLISINVILLIKSYYMDTMYGECKKSAHPLNVSVGWMHSEMPSERKKKKRTPYPLEWTPGLLGNESYVLSTLTYVSVDESVGNKSIYGPEVGTKCQE